MLVKLGVNIGTLGHECRHALSSIEQMHKTNGLSECVITSTGEGNHKPGSLHYTTPGRAFDVRKFGDGMRQTQLYKTFLPKGFDVVNEDDHIHVEWDPK